MPERSELERYALLMGARTKLSKEECVGGMGQRKKSNVVAVMDAQNKPRTVECASNMEQKGQNANTRDAIIML